MTSGCHIDGADMKNISNIAEYSIGQNCLRNYTIFINYTLISTVIYFYIIFFQSLHTLSNPTTSHPVIVAKKFHSLEIISASIITLLSNIVLLDLLCYLNSREFMEVNNQIVLDQPYSDPGIRDFRV